MFLKVQTYVKYSDLFLEMGREELPVTVYLVNQKILYRVQALSLPVQIQEPSLQALYCPV